MNRLKRAIATVCLFTLAAVLVACQSTALPTAKPTIPPSASAYAPSPAPQASEASQRAAASATPSLTALPGTPSPTPDETEEPEPEPTYDIPDIQKAGLTNEQYEKIDVLLYGALFMGKHFNNTASLNPVDLLAFTFQVLNDQAAVIGYNDDLSVLSTEQVQKIIQSALNIEYKPKTGDNYDSLLVYQGGHFSFSNASGDPQQYVNTFNIKHLSSNRIQVVFDDLLLGDQTSKYVGKMQAILQADKSSLFGYHIIQLSKANDSKPHFSHAASSSFLPAASGKTFKPENVIDKKDKTAWVTGKGVGQWIQLSSHAVQTTTGMDILVGDRSGSDDNMYKSGQPVKIKLEFSDGTTIVRDIDMPDTVDNHFCISFGREIKTTYIKITILSVSDVATAKDVYIFEIIPF